MAISLDPQIVARLDRIIELLEQQNKPDRNPIPDIPPLTSMKPVEDVATCPKCGITLDKITGYVCGVSRCPTGLGPIM